MADYVFHASVCVAWCFEDETTERVKNLFFRLSNDDRLLVPAHWPVEISNTFLQAQRRKRVTSTQVEGFWDQLARLRFAVEQPLNVSLAKDVLRLSEKHSLTVYDGAYLELAMRNRIPLATLDTQLEGAAKRNKSHFCREANQPADSAVVVTVSGRMPMLAAATLSRLVFFTRYIASSARCSNPSLVRESTG
jgi:predicted nucleic acid-binding protein